MTAALTGRAIARSPNRPRTLVCTADGIWLWPGTPLTERRGVALVPLPRSQLYQHVAMLHGPSVQPAMLARAIARAAACLNQGRLQDADDILAAVPIPPVSFDGAALMQAISKRLGVRVPDVAVAGWPSNSRTELFEQLARVHDRKLAAAIILEPAFNPGLRRVAPANAPFDPTLHPRWPAGQSDGGRFRPRDGSPIAPAQGLGTAIRVARQLLSRLWPLLRRVPKSPKTGERPPSAEPLPKKPTSEPPAEEPGPAEERSPGIGHNRPPDDGVPTRSEPENSPRPNDLGARPDQPFKLPAERPTGEGEVAQWGQHAADEIREALARNDTRRLVEIADALAQADWIKDQLDNIIAAQDPPRSLDELIDAAQEPGRRRFGYDNHHIIEQGPQNEDVSREIINAPYNIARIPRYKHWEITEYYRWPREETGGVSPRLYLKGKSPAERYQFGLGVLRKFGVLQ
ncbi:MAG TPA: hypothetical protein VJO12_09230 [Stellaceae bacterium]|nr:hypothetical protein [Stellaceae bacterium]